MTRKSKNRHRRFMRCFDDMVSKQLTTHNTAMTKVAHRSSFHLNSLDPGRFQFNFREVIFKLILVNGGRGISYEIALRWMPQDLTDCKSTLVQVMVWRRPAPSHYLSQWWHRSLPLYGITKPQWVKKTSQVNCSGIWREGSWIFLQIT